MSRLTFAAYLESVYACSEAREWVGDRPFSREMWQTARADWMLWLAQHARVGISAQVRAAALCAWSVLPLVREQDRAACASAVDCARRYALAEAVTVDECRDAAYAARAAAYAAHAAAHAVTAAASAAHAVSAAVTAAYAAVAAAYTYAAVAAAYTYAAAAAAAAAHELASGVTREQALVRLNRYVRFAIGYRRMRRALVAQGVEVAL